MRLPGTRTPKETAKELKTSLKRIHALIKSGELLAINMAGESSRLPRYLISDEAIQIYRDRLVNQSLNVATIPMQRSQPGRKRILTIERHV